MRIGLKSSKIILYKFYLVELALLSRDISSEAGTVKCCSDRNIFYSLSENEIKSLFMQSHLLQNPQQH